MESRNNAFNVHTYLQEQAPLIIEYLKITAKKYFYIGELFEKPSRRLFFKETPEQDFQIIENIFNKEELLEDFGKKLQTWKPLFSDHNINMSRQMVRDFYFLPIKQHPDWPAFYSSQEDLIKPRFKTEKNLSRKMQFLEDELAGAFSFRIISAYLQNNPGIMTEKANLLAKILNVTTSTNTLIVEFEDTLTRDINNIFGFFISSRASTQDFSDAIANMFNNNLFNGLELAPTILWNVVNELLEKADEKEKESEFSKKIKKTLTDFIFNRILENDNSISPHTPYLLRKISPNLKTSVKLKHPHLFQNPLETKSVSDTSLLDKRKKYKEKHSFFSFTQNKLNPKQSTRKLSAPPSVEKDSLDTTPRIDLSASSITPRSESDVSTLDSDTTRSESSYTQVALIRPIRPNRMRKRHSLVSIFFTPKSESEEEKMPHSARETLSSPKEEMGKK